MGGEVFEGGVLFVVVEVFKGVLHFGGRDAGTHESVEGFVIGALFVRAHEVEDGEIAGEAANEARVAEDNREQGLEADGAHEAVHGVALDDMLHLVGEDGGELVGVIHAVDEAAEDDDVPARGGEGVDFGVTDDGYIEGVRGEGHGGLEAGGDGCDELGGGFVVAGGAGAGHAGDDGFAEGVFPGERDEADDAAEEEGDGTVEAVAGEEEEAEGADG